MHIIIAGSRNVKDYNIVEPIIHECLHNLNITVSSISSIVSGTADGVDLLGEQFALKNNLNISKFPAQWNDLTIKPCKIKYNKFGKPYNTLAGFNRNNDMAMFANAAIVIVLNNSSGSINMIKTMQKLNKPVSAKYLYW